MNKKSNCKKVTCNGDIYVGVLKDGKVTVKVQRTANGQLIKAETFVIETQTWRQDGKRYGVPAEVKAKFEKFANGNKK